MHYPTDFPDPARAKVEAEEIRASFEFDGALETAQWKADKEKWLRNYILRVFLVFVSESCSRRLWAVDKTRDFCEEFLRRLTIEAYYSKGYPRGLADMTSHLNGSILTEVQTEFEKAPAWLVFRKALLQLADDQVGKSDAAESSVSSQAQSLTGDAESGEASQHSDGLVQADQATAIVESTAITKQELLEQLRNLAPEDRLVHAQAFHYAKVKNGGTFTGDAFLINEATQKRLLAFRSLSDDDRADVLREIPFSEPIDRESVNKRRTVVEPILNRRGLSIQDWAKNSKVDFHTANDYLKGITSPYPSTRKKLAESIGINADDLPK